MKKRELLIVAGFAAAAVLAYQFTAGAPEPSAPRRSVSSVVDSIRREVVGDAAGATVSRSGTVAVAAGVSELRVAGVSEVTVSGESRGDIAYSLEVEARAPTEREAQAQAGEAALHQDDLGEVLALSVRLPAEGRSRSHLVLKVPARLAVRLASQGAMTTRVTAVAAARLDVVGNTTLVNVHAITGSHRNGAIAVEGAGAVTLFMQGSDATLVGVKGPTALTARGGRSDVKDSTGTLTLETTNHEAVLTDHDGTIRVSGTGGTFRVQRPRRDVNIDVRRARVDVEIDRAMSLTALTSDAPLTIVTRDVNAMTVDAAVTEGRIAADDFGMTAVTQNGDSTLMHRVEGTTARMTLRNRDGVIVLRKTK